MHLYDNKYSQSRLNVTVYAIPYTFLNIVNARLKQHNY